MNTVNMCFYSPGMKNVFFSTIKDYSPFMAILVPSNNTFACGRNVNYKINYTVMYVHIYSCLLIIERTMKKLFIAETRASKKATIERRFYFFGHLFD